MHADSPSPRRRVFATLGLLILLSISPAETSQVTVSAGEPAPSVLPATLDVPATVRSAIGVTRDGTRIDLLLQDGDTDLETEKTRLLLIGGIDGDANSVAAVLDIMKWFHGSDEAASWRRQMTLSAVPCADPAALRATSDAAARPAPLTFPSGGKAYHDGTHRDEGAYLWRWLGMHAPDLVIDLRNAPTVSWQRPESTPELEGLAAMESIGAEGDLIVELGRHDVCLSGPMPALRLRTPAGKAVASVRSLLNCLPGSVLARPSAARLALQRRLDRSPTTVAQQLSNHYGHDLKQVVYIPAIALIGQLRLNDADGPLRTERVKAIVRPYFDGQRPSKPTSGSGLSGHLIFGELAAASDGAERARYLELARQAADMGLTDDGKVRPIMPFHSEMSDAAFMGGPILVQVGRLTGDPRYLQAAVTHLRAIRALDERPDGLYRHSPLDEAAWGRGNGFPALGLAMCLADFPADHPGRDELLPAFQKHLRALARHQDPTGAWHQVIDRPESYRELTSTCMIAYAMACGIRHGWLPANEFQPLLDRAWYAIRTRVLEDGRLVDVCTGTGKQRSLRAYYDRTAILGRDPRGGAMALLVATEMMKARPSDKNAAP